MQTRARAMRAFVLRAAESRRWRYGACSAEENFRHSRPNRLRPPPFSQEPTRKGEFRLTLASWPPSCLPLRGSFQIVGDSYNEWREGSSLEIILAERVRGYRQSKAMVVAQKCCEI